VSREVGNRAEEIACEWLKEQGCHILERNVYSRFGEIDIIAEREGVLHFIEVKSGTGFEPIYNITPQKVSKIIKTVDYYRMKHRVTMAYCIDALIVEDDEIDFIENITL